MPDIAVRFTGDTSDLQAGAVQARRTLDDVAGSTASLKASLDALNASMKDARASTDAATSGWRADLQALADLTIVVRNAVAGVEDFADVLTRAGAIDARAIFDVQRVSFAADADAARGLAAAIGDVARADAAADADLAHGVAATIAAAPSAFAAAGAAVTAYATAAAFGSGANASFITAQEGVLASLGRTVLAFETSLTAARLYDSGLAGVELAGVAAAGALDSFQAESRLAGKSASDALLDFTAELLQIPGLSDEAAASIETMFASVPNYSAQANALLIALTRQISSTADDAVANARRIADAFRDAEQGGATLGGIVASLQKLQDVEVAATTISHMLQPAQAAAFYDTILSKLQAQAAAQKAANDGQAAALKDQDWLSRLLDIGARRQLDAETQKLALLQAQIQALQGQKAIYDQIAAVAQRQATFDATLDKANPIDAQLEALQGRRDILQGQLDRNAALAASSTPLGSRSAANALSAEDIAALVRTVIGEAGNQSAQGQLAVAAVALNRLANGNFGDSLTAVLKAGDGTQFNTWKPADKGGSSGDQANAPTPVDSYQFQRTLHDIVLPLLQKQVEDPTGGALNFYNPSLMPPQNRFAMNGETMIGDHLFGTAKNAPAPVAPMDPDEIAKTDQAIAAIDAQIKKLNDEKAGGTAIDQAQLEIAQQHAAGLRDAVAEQQKLVDAAKAEVAASAGLAPQVQTEAAKRLADAEAALRDKQVESEIAASKVEAAGLEQNSFEQVAVLNRALADKLGLYAQDSAAYKTTLDEMSANTRRAVDAQTAMVKEKVGVAALARTATGVADPIADAQAKLDQARQGLAQTGQMVGPQGVVVPDPSQAPGSTKAQLAAQTAYYQAVADLRAADQAKQHAADALAVAGTQEGSKARLDAQLEMYRGEIAAAGDDQAKILGIEREITEAKRAFAKQQAADAAETENAAFDATQRRFVQERAAMEENARLGQITQAQKTAQVTASLDAQLAATKAHFAALAQIEQTNGTDGPMAQVRLAQRAAVAEDRINAERVAAARSANAAIAQDYKSVFEQIGSTISSTLMQMIQGQARVRDLARAVVLDLIQQFIQARIKIVADWAAGQVAQVAQTVSAETAKTAATAAGTAARTDLVGIASLEQAALVGAGVLKSILASSAETFAGIFGFLSPIMGPAAVGPAAAGQATVAAAAGMAAFDIGTWSLPSSGVAMVHAGEMIVPAAQTPWAQSLMAAAAGGSGAGGRAAPPVHFNVSALDAGDVKRFFAANSRAILNAIDVGIRSGSHLALARVGKP